DQVRGKGFAGIGGIAIRHHQLARPRQQPWPTGGDERIDVLERRVPASEPALRHGAFEAGAYGSGSAGRLAAKAVKEAHQRPFTVVTRSWRTIRRPSAPAISRSSASMARS